MDYTITEAATRAGVSDSTIRAARKSGAFKNAKLGRATGSRTPPWLIPGDDLDAAGFVPVTATSASAAAGPVYIEERLVLLGSQLAEALELLAVHGDVAADWVSFGHEIAAAHGESLQAIILATRDCAAAKHLADLDQQVLRLTAGLKTRDDRLHSELVRLSAQAKARDDRLLSIAADVIAVRDALEDLKPSRGIGLRRRLFAAFGG